MSSRVSQEVITEMRNMKASGASIIKIMEHTGLSRSTVGKYIGPVRHPRATPDDVAEMRKLREQGLTHAQIGEALGLSGPTVTKHLGGYLSGRQRTTQNVKENHNGRPESQLDWTWADWQSYWRSRR